MRVDPGLERKRPQHAQEQRVGRPRPRDGRISWPHHHADEARRNVRALGLGGVGGRRERGSEARRLRGQPAAVVAILVIVVVSRHAHRTRRAEHLELHAVDRLTAQGEQLGSGASLGEWRNRRAAAVGVHVLDHVRAQRH